MKGNKKVKSIFHCFSSLSSEAMKEEDLTEAQLTGENIERFWIGGKTIKNEHNRIQGDDLPNVLGGKRWTFHAMDVFNHFQN